jgi:hypothetical protein
MQGGRKSSDDRRSHKFDGIVRPGEDAHQVNLYQLCDLEEPLLNALVHINRRFRSVCDVSIVGLRGHSEQLV